MAEANDNATAPIIACLMVFISFVLFLNLSLLKANCSLSIGKPNIETFCRYIVKNESLPISALMLTSASGGNQKLVAILSALGCTFCAEKKCYHRMQARRVRDIRADVCLGILPSIRVEAFDLGAQLHAKIFFTDF